MLAHHLHRTRARGRSLTPKSTRRTRLPVCVHVSSSNLCHRTRAGARAQAKAARGQLGARGGREAASGGASSELSDRGAASTPPAAQQPLAAGGGAAGSPEAANARRRPPLAAAAVLAKQRRLPPPKECTLQLREKIAFGTATSAFQVCRGHPTCGAALNTEINMRAGTHDRQA